MKKEKTIYEENNISLDDVAELTIFEMNLMREMERLGVDELTYTDDDGKEYTVTMEKPIDQEKLEKDGKLEEFTKTIDVDGVLIETDKEEE